MLCLEKIENGDGQLLPNSLQNTRLNRWAFSTKTDHLPISLHLHLSLPKAPCAIRDSFFENLPHVVSGKASLFGLALCGPVSC